MIIVARNTKLHVNTVCDDLNLTPDWKQVLSVEEQWLWQALIIRTGGPPISVRILAAEIGMTYSAVAKALGGLAAHGLLSDSPPSGVAEISATEHQ